MLWGKMPGREQMNWRHALPRYTFPKSARSVLFNVYHIRDCFCWPRAVMTRSYKFLRANLLSVYRYDLVVTTDGVLICGLDLLTSYIPHSELHVITALSLVSKLHKSQQHPLSILQPAAYITCFPGTASNSGDSSASRPQVLLSQLPV
jgi:hypothetical protein